MNNTATPAKKEPRKLPKRVNGSKKTQESDSESEEEDNSTIRCICKDNTDHGLMIQCEKCAVWQHSICVGIRGDKAVPKHYFCELCSTREFKCLCGKNDVPGKVIQCSQCSTWQHIRCLGKSTRALPKPYKCPACDPTVVNPTTIQKTKKKKKGSSEFEFITIKEIREEMEEDYFIFLQKHSKLDNLLPMKTSDFRTVLNSNFFLLEKYFLKLCDSMSEKEKENVLDKDDVIRGVGIIIHCDPSIVRQCFEQLIKQITELDTKIAKPKANDWSKGWSNLKESTYSLSAKRHPKFVRKPDFPSCCESQQEISSNSSNNDSSPSTTATAPVTTTNENDSKNIETVSTSDSTTTSAPSKEVAVEETKVEEKVEDKVEIKDEIKTENKDNNINANTNTDPNTNNNTDTDTNTNTNTTDVDSTIKKEETEAEVVPQDQQSKNENGDVIVNTTGTTDTTTDSVKSEDLNGDSNTIIKKEENINQEEKNTEEGKEVEKVVEKAEEKEEEKEKEKVVEKPVEKEEKEEEKKEKEKEEEKEKNVTPIKKEVKVWYCEEESCFCRRYNKTCAENCYCGCANQEPHDSEKCQNKLYKDIEREMLLRSDPSRANNCTTESNRETESHSVRKISVSKLKSETKSENNNNDSEVLPDAETETECEDEYGVFRLIETQPKQFMMEFLGNVIEYDQIYTNVQPTDRYFILLRYEKDICIDARKSGNIARFIRRSCTPNSVVKEIFLNNQLHLAVYSIDSIQPNTEITVDFDFNWKGSLSKYSCACSKPETCPLNLWYEQRKLNVEKLAEAMKPVVVPLPTVESTSVPTNSNTTTSATSSPVITNIATINSQQPSTSSAPQSTNSTTSSSMETTTTSNTENENGQDEDDHPAKKRKVETSSSITPSTSESLQEESKDFDKLSREERKLAMLMKSIQKMEKRQNKKRKQTKENTDSKTPKKKRENYDEDYVDVDTKKDDNGGDVDSTSSSPSVSRENSPMITNKTKEKQTSRQEKLLNKEKSPLRNEKFSGRREKLKKEIKQVTQMNSKDKDDDDDYSNENNEDKEVEIEKEVKKDKRKIKTSNSSVSNKTNGTDNHESTKISTLKEETTTNSNTNNNSEHKSPRITQIQSYPDKIKRKMSKEDTHHTYSHNTNNNSNSNLNNSTVTTTPTTTTSTNNNLNSNSNTNSNTNTNSMSKMNKFGKKAWLLEFQEEQQQKENENQSLTPRQSNSNSAPTTPTALMPKKKFLDTFLNESNLLSTSTPTTSSEVSTQQTVNQ